ncbi:CLUMA_CG010798, isoform A [Clunio marinus]|uniref:CLUMA_CG010798, isoform A n=1 Tax=Clunio marinus TaxID=568069 RepID=A0A1J1IG37_9DIPT|nr:CLUMA_CG010798, isoform A [Clunio marinus]
MTIENSYLEAVNQELLVNKRKFKLVTNSSKLMMKLKVLKTLLGLVPKKYAAIDIDFILQRSFLCTLSYGDSQKGEGNIATV